MHTPAFLILRALLLLSCLGLASESVAEDWPRFRGPTGMGQTSEKDLPLAWGGESADKHENVAWKASLPSAIAGVKADLNQSSPIVSAGRVFVTTSHWPEGKTNKEFPEHHVACYQAEDGKLVWDKVVAPGPWLLSDLRGGYTAPTPAADGERVYVLFGSAVLAALDFEGNLVWRKELADFKSFDVAIGASPIVLGDKVLMLCDKNNRHASLTAFDAKTGEVAWEVKRPDVAFAHSTPVVAEVDGKSQILVSASNAIQGLDPADGKPLWWIKTPGDACSPIYGAGLIYSDSGRGGPGIAFEPMGSGLLPPERIKWKVDQIPEGLSSPVIAGEYLYRMHNPQVLKCFKLSSGEQAFSTRLVGVSTLASPVATPEGRVYFASAGKSYVLKSGPALEILATNDLGDGGHGSPAISGARIFLKGNTTLFAVGKK